MEYIYMFHFFVHGLFHRNFELTPTGSKMNSHGC